VTVTEDYELDKYRQPTRLMFLTLDADALKHLHFDATQMEATIEDISDKLDPVLQGMWGKHMYRIVLTIRPGKLKNRIKYIIR
jgi:hypothetical protein